MRMNKLHPQFIDRLIPRLNMHPIGSIVRLRPTERQIPKKIHQVFFSDRALPKDIAINIDLLRQQNPEWEYCFYNDQDMHRFVKENYSSEIIDSYDKLEKSYGAACVDFFRYLLLYRVGGIYLDIKSSSSRPLSSVIRADDTFLLSQWRNSSDEKYAGWGLHDDINWVPGGEFQQWYIAAAPEHPFLAAVIANVVRNIKLYNRGLHGSGQYGVLRVTGPIAYTASIAPILHLFPYRRVDSENDLGLIYSIYDDERHVKLFKEHYSELRIPIVKQGINERFLSFVYQMFRLAKKIQNYFKKLSARHS
jgi:mannosyltransferase OCH1-like enzyme